MHPTNLTRSITIATLAVLLAALAGCADQKPSEKAASKQAREAHLVEVEIVRRKPVSTHHERSGSLRTRRFVHIYSQEEGRITELPLFEGDRVRKGDTLVRLEEDLLRAELAKADATTRQAQVDLKRMRDLAARDAASADEVAQAKTALDVAIAEQQILETRLRRTRIRAPFDGVISARYKEPGDVVPRHTHMLTLSDPSSLVTELRVSELLLPLVSTGDRVDVRIDALGGQVFPGRILRIHPEVDSKTRRGTVEVVLEPVPPGARAGQFARVTVHSAAVERILIPFSALQRDRRGAFVYVLDDAKKVHRREVRSGLHIADRVEIVAGLQPEQLIITRGFLGLKEGKSVDPVDRQKADRTANAIMEDVSVAPPAQTARVAGAKHGD